MKLSCSLEEINHCNVSQNTRGQKEVKTEEEEN